MIFLFAGNALKDIFGALTFVIWVNLVGVTSYIINKVGESDFVSAPNKIWLPPQFLSCMD